MDKIALLTQILTQNPTDAFARYGLAMEHTVQGNPDAALAEPNGETDRAGAEAVAETVAAIPDLSQFV